MIHIGIDTGGTFTDLVAIDAERQRGYTAKVPSNPADPLSAILAAIHQAGIDPAEAASLILGTTVGTNALLERRGAKVVYLTTTGFEDVPFIQRGNRRHHYDLNWIKPRPFIERRYCLGVPERMDYRGRVETPLSPDNLKGLQKALERRVEGEEIDAIAVNLLFAYLNPEHELQLAKWLEQNFPGLPVSLSHQVAPVWREYERGLSTIADAYLRPLLETFIGSIDAGLREKGFRGRWALMKSNGGMRLAEDAAREPLQLLLSGLAGGVMGGKAFAGRKENLITLDIGGTSSDIAVITGGDQRYAMQYEVEFGLPLLLPTIEITTIGAGGGSIAWIDGGGFLRVGPRSAGAVPGPACYGRGGIEPTLTDANLVLGRLDPDYFLGGRVKLDRMFAEKAVGDLAERLGSTLQQAALAIVNIANDNMMNAIRLRTVEAGIDPSGYSLAAFGGAGGLQAAAIARLMNIKRVIIPPHPGLCSAFGALTADLRCDRVWTTGLQSDNVVAAELAGRVQSMTKEAEAEIRTQNYRGDIQTRLRLALRYQGQNYEHEIELPGAHIDEDVLKEAYAEFNRLHDAFYGYNLSGEVIEIVNLTVTALGKSGISIPDYAAAGTTPNQSSRPVCFTGEQVLDTPIVRRESLCPGSRLEGPAIVEESDSTTLIEPGDAINVAENGAMIIEIQ